MSETAQGELDFGTPGAGDGLEHWRAQRRQAVHALAEKLGLPLGRWVEVRLTDGVMLRGALRLREETLFLDQVDAAHLELAVDRVNFRHGEVESCLALD